jgi:DNA-binding MarR family transcriptional regulator
VSSSLPSERATNYQERAIDAEGPSLRIRLLHTNVITTGWRLSNLANFFTVPFFRVLEQRTGLSRSEYVIMFCLAHYPGVTAQEIVVASGRPKNSISVSVAKLERKKLISRQRRAVDPRQNELRLTAEGRNIYAEVTPLLQAREQAMTAILSKNERQQLDALLLKMGLNIFVWESSYGDAP